ncbi:Targeting protein for Xklp2 [Eufriesea mexicana]|nr:Targeting protein for Xklp2 [Eufriesea mexicana]
MLSPAKLLNVQHGQTAPPMPYIKNNYTPSRKLWQKENIEVEAANNNWNNYRKPIKDEKWDVIESPQFVDFSNLPNIGDSFFNKLTVIVSTPNPNLTNIKLPSTVTEADTLVASLNNISLIDAKYETAEKENDNYNDEQKKEKEEYVVHNASIKVKNEIKTEACKEVKKPHSTAIYPFNFDLREKYKQEYKQERMKKMMKEEKQIKTFRATPLPKFIKVRATTVNNHNNNNKNEMIKTNGKNTNFPDKRMKKNAEIWKKPPFIPCLSKKKLQVAKTPSLRTATRAQERKEFDNTLKEIQRQREETRQMVIHFSTAISFFQSYNMYEIAARKKQEEEEIAKLRKQTVHKAQPIRKYKMDLPPIEKRPLTDPISPMLLKRRRRV